MGVGIAGQQHRLEEQQADAPDGGGSSEPGQDEPAHDGLDLEQQESAEEDRYREENPVHRYRLYHSDCALDSMYKL